MATCQKPGWPCPCLTLGLAGLVMWLQRSAGVFGLWLLMAAPAATGAVHMVQEGPAPQLIELYTSQGCSSCPAADRWLNRLKDNRRLWQDVVPVAFHVDYWNSLGWPDTLSQAQFTDRQRAYRQFGWAGSVYTPGFMVDGREWRGYFSGARLPDTRQEASAGTLTVWGEAGAIMLAWLPTEHALDTRNRRDADAYIGSIALLGFDLKVEIKAGENRNRTLDYDFAVLHFVELNLALTKGKWHASMQLPAGLQPAPRYGLAAWVTPTNDAKPLQALGGWFVLADLIAQQ